MLIKKEKIFLSTDIILKMKQKGKFSCGKRRKEIHIKKRTNRG